MTRDELEVHLQNFDYKRLFIGVCCLVAAVMAFIFVFKFITQIAVAVLSVAILSVAANYGMKAAGFEGYFCWKKKKKSSRGNGGWTIEWNFVTCCKKVNDGATDDAEQD